MARTGEKIITLTDLEQRLVALDKRIKGILSMIVLNNTSGEIRNWRLLHDRQTILGAGTNVTFIKPFKTGTVPTVKGTSETQDCSFCLTTAPTATGFSAKSRFHDGTAQNSTCGWIAVGEVG